MENKNGKTFADLLSSSTKETESNINTDPLENKQEKVTFDNLFDQSSDKISKEEENNHKNENNLNTLFQKAIETEEVTTPEKESITLNNLFDSNEQSDNDEKTNTKEPEKEEQSIFEKNSTKEEQLEFNPFFQKEPDQTKDNYQEQENIEKEEVTTPEKGSITLNNLFDSNEQSNNEEKINTKEPEKEEQSIFEKNSTKEDQIEFNPFFQKEPNQTKDIPELENPFFSSTPQTNSNDEKIIPDNPFFDNNELSTKQEKIKEVTLDKEKNTEVSEPFKSTSPFFSDEDEESANPFFQNNISLIENITQEKSSQNIDTKNTKHFNVKIVKKKEPLPKFIFGVLSYAAFILLLFLGITLLIYVLDIKIRAAKGDFSSPTYNAYVVLTGSMLPEIQVHDVVITKKTDPSKLEEGDIITFASADSRFLGTIITHRIKKKNYDAETKSYTFQTKGDNNNVADNALVPEKNIYGKVILKIPKLGFIQEFLASRGGWIIVILIPCLTVISYDIVKLTKGLKRKKYKNIKVQK